MRSDPVSLLYVDFAIEWKVIDLSENGRLSETHKDCHSAKLHHLISSFWRWKHRDDKNKNIQTQRQFVFMIQFMLLASVFI